MTLREVQIASARRLAEEPALRDHASRDAAALLLHALRVEPTALYAHPERPLTDEESTEVDALVQRRLRHEPMQYILGEQEFYGLPFRVTPATLIPRPETELLVEAVLDRLPPEDDLRIADVGTGSGAIAIALARHLPGASLFALDISASALIAARENARSNGVFDRVTFRLANVLDGLPPGVRLDAVVSNPPYVPESDRSSLHPQVRDFEPARALFAGADGLSIFRKLIPQARDILEHRGLLAMEFGFGQAEALDHLLAEWHSVRFLDDLQGIPRVVVARRP